MLNRARLKSLAEHEDKRAQAVLDLDERSDELNTTILICNTIANVGLAALGTMIAQKLWNNGGAGAAVMTVLILIIGELSPKTLADETPDSFAMMFSPVFKGLVRICTPLNWLLVKWKACLRKLVRVKEEPAFTQDELINIVEEAEQEGGMNADESELLKSAIEFHDLDVGDILTPRVKVEGVSADATMNEAADQFEQAGYSRLPVYEETLDHIVGIVHQKDFYNRVRKGGEFRLTEIMKEAVCVPAGAKISDTLKLLQRTQSQMAIVTDEYGGTEGIVTMEDILEELVGEIWDEHDEVEEPFRMNEAGTSCHVLGSADPEEMFEKLGIDDETESSTVSGWVMEKTEKIPQPGDTFECGGWHATVLKADDRHVQEIQLTLNA